MPAGFEWLNPGSTYASNEGRRDRQESPFFLGDFWRRHVLALSLKESDTYAALARIRSSGQHDTNI
jgi:hypothetical protein